MTKRIVVCGDSFNCNDPDYGDLHWTQKLKKLLPNDEIINISIPGSSNFLIHAQIDRAISLKPDCVISSFTTCLRGDFKINDKQKTDVILDRFFKIGDDNTNADLCSFPYSAISYINIIEKNRGRILKEYVLECVDVDVERLKNYYIINNALNTLTENGINFLYSKGGFEHPVFMKPEEVAYQFQKFENHELPINMWDNFEHPKSLRPYFHNSNDETHHKIAEFCKSKIE